MRTHPTTLGAAAPEVDCMPLDLTRRDDAGNPIDDETFDRLIEREYAERDRDELRVERYIAPENPELVAFRVVDREGHVRGFIGFEYGAMEWGLPERTLARVKRAASPPTPLRLVG